jgi:hypothetical protein
MICMAFGLVDVTTFAAVASVYEVSPAKHEIRTLVAAGICSPQ